MMTSTLNMVTMQIEDRLSLVDDGFRSDLQLVCFGLRFDRTLELGRASWRTDLILQVLMK